MYSEEASCSDCKLEIIQIRWTQLLLNWRNKCVHPKKKTDLIDMKTLGQIIKKYKDEISTDAMDKALLSPDSIELFIKYKYPIARLENLSEEKDLPKKMYIMASILLFYCCVNSQSGKVDADICSHLNKEEQEMILKFCEILNEYEVTINNVDTAIEEACKKSKTIKKMFETHCKIKNNNTTKLATEISSNDSLQRKENAPAIEEKRKVTIQDNTDTNTKGSTVKKFQSSVTVLPSIVTDTSSYSRSSAEHLSDSDLTVNTQIEKVNVEDDTPVFNSKDITIERMEAVDNSQEDSCDQTRRCQPSCACTRCSVTGPCCGDPGSSMDQCAQKPKKHMNLKEFQYLPNKRRKYLSNWKLYLMLFIGILLSMLLITTTFMIPKKPQEEIVKNKRSAETVTFYPEWIWQCKDKLCQKVLSPASNTNVYSSHSRCTLLCMGPQLWPYPIGFTHFSKTIIALTTKKLNYKFQSIPSDLVHQYLATAFNFFIKELITLERISTKPQNLTADLKLMKINIRIYVDNDSDPRLRTNTDESYYLQIESKDNQVLIKVSAPSFCGIRHGLETLSQLILLDETSGYLITVSSATIKDSPSYKYRGLMIDTGRNFIPVPDLIKTIDGMSTCKLNTFHWRISDATSFPLQLPEIPELLEFGPYDRSMVYTREDIISVVERAGSQCIRVLIEVAMPGPVGRPWSWSPQVSCSRTINNDTCDDELCLRFKMQHSFFDTLQIIYSAILDLTNVDDIFHMSSGVFSISNCFNLVEERVGFLDKALERLKLANGGFMPKLPIIWYTAHLTQELEAKAWDRTWQEMYSWTTWRNVEVFTIEGGEAVLWTDLVNSGNLDYHLWPRTAAVAERLWSDMVINSSASLSVFTRLDFHRSRMLLRGIDVQPIWPAWCSFNPTTCLNKIY